MFCLTRHSDFRLVNVSIIPMRLPLIAAFCVFSTSAQAASMFEYDLTLRFESYGFSDATVLHNDTGDVLLDKPFMSDDENIWGFDNGLRGLEVGSLINFSAKGTPGPDGDATRATSESCSVGGFDCNSASAGGEFFGTFSEAAFNIMLGLTQSISGGTNIGDTVQLTFAKDEFGSLQEKDDVALFYFDAINYFTVVEPSSVRAASGTNNEITPVPLPANGWLLLVGLAGLGFAAVRRRVLGAA
ncbi:hypothetical protein [uncultured Roseobacter sp.]|uniref:hypothetical protein n=1 Tax=uncultured Roseobacter sp. TaxID=114847 RepID=UPI0026046741|nr:hypothetical protein [uncultured Roseobacter sp.]